MKCDKGAQNNEKVRKLWKRCKKCGKGTQIVEKVHKTWKRCMKCGQGARNDEKCNNLNDVSKIPSHFAPYIVPEIIYPCQVSNPPVMRYLLTSPWVGKLAKVLALFW